MQPQRQHEPSSHLSPAAAAGRSVAAGGTVGEAEVVPEATGLLEGLGEHLVLLDVVVRHGPEARTGDLSIPTFECTRSITSWRTSWPPRSAPW